MGRLAIGPWGLWLLEAGWGCWFSEGWEGSWGKVMVGFLAGGGLLNSEPIDWLGIKLYRKFRCG